MNTALSHVPRRRVLSVWFPFFGAQRLLLSRDGGGDPLAPFATVQESGQMQVLCSVSPSAAEAGLRVGQPLRDAMAICPALVTRQRDRAGEATFLTELRRRALRFSPWVAPEGEDGFVLDTTGCAHLFGSEETMVQALVDDHTAPGLTVRAAIADTRGAAWALARHADRRAAPHRSGDMIDQEARATRSRAVKRQAMPQGRAGDGNPPPGAWRIAPPGKMHGALAPLPVAALRLEPDIVEKLSRLGLRRIGDLIGQPRAGLARRFGEILPRRLDQALGTMPEPLSPEQPETRFSRSLAPPDPVTTLDEVLALCDRVLPPLCALLQKHGHAARILQFHAILTDATVRTCSITLARASTDPDRIRPLLALKLDGMDTGFGIDMIRLVATRTEAAPATRTPHPRAWTDQPAPDQPDGLSDLVARIGSRIGMDRITLRHPAESHIPEKSSLILSAAWADPHGDWPAPAMPARPLLLWRPEPLRAQSGSPLRSGFHWRRNRHSVQGAIGPERITPEWWTDEPDWRSGTRDYWHVTLTSGERLWLFLAHGDMISGGWFCHGRFA